MKEHEPGIYFFMDADEYHADPALGSTDLRTFMDSPERYWRRSPFNPNRDLYVDEETKATTLGTALHTYLLEGRPKFESVYARRPEDKPGASSADKSAVTKKFKAALMPHQTMLHGDEWRFIEEAGFVVTKHPDLVDLFVGGDHEVSIFWVNALGVRCKCRLDLLKPRGIGDLKSIANPFDRPLPLICKLAIRNAKYYVQAEHYLEGRGHLRDLVAKEKMFICQGPGVSVGLGKVKGSALLVAIAERMIACAFVKERSAFVFVFISKQAPECWACVLSPGNPILETARERIDTAMQHYTQLRTDFGSKPWPADWRLEELAPEEMPGGEFHWQ